MILLKISKFGIIQKLIYIQVVAMYLHPNRYRKGSPISTPPSWISIYPPNAPPPNKIASTNEG